MTSTSPTAQHQPRSRRVSSIVVIVIVGLIGIVVASFGAGYGLNLRGFGRAVISFVKSVSSSQTVKSYSQGEFRNIIFLHHSVGTNLLNDTDLRQRFSQSGYYFWDHAYNWQGQFDPTGQSTGYSYNIPEDGSDPHDFARIFAQPIYGLPLNALSSLMQHEVIMFKSCFPASSIKTDQQLQDYKTWYLSMRDVMDQHLDKIFIAITPPPLLRSETTAAEAQRARTFANWLKSDEFTQGHSNVFVFDLFGLLADDDPQANTLNTLRPDYSNGLDSHPNAVANQAVAPQLFEFVTHAIEQYKQSR